MPDRADAHAHLFFPGFVDKLPENCRRVRPDEVTLYEALAQRHDVRQLLAVGFEGAEAYRGNNDYLAGVAATRPWVRPVAYLNAPSELAIPALQSLRARKFVGVTFYLFDAALTEQLAGVSDEVWKWIVDHRLLISVNSTKEHWTAWKPVLDRFPDLRLIVSHLGLPGVINAADEAAGALKTVTDLAPYRGVRVKLSGFYAMTGPGHDYPHERAWPLVQRLLETFGHERLLWGSDFSPSLEHLSFQQTFDLFGKMPFLSPERRAAIEGANLIQLLDDVQ